MATDSLVATLEELFYDPEFPSVGSVLRACLFNPAHRAEIIHFAVECNDQVAEDEMHARSPAKMWDKQSSYLPISDPTVEAAYASLGVLAGTSLRRAARAANLGAATPLLFLILTGAIETVPKEVLNRLAYHLNVAPSALLDAIFHHSLEAEHFRVHQRLDQVLSIAWSLAVERLDGFDDIEKCRLRSLA